MKIIFSPTKTMKKIDNSFPFSTPKYINESKSIINENLNVLINSEQVNQAIFYYQGISYKYLDSSSLPIECINYLNENLIILSALYGALKPLDMIMSYRLDFVNNKLLYDFWTKYCLVDSNELIINLASNEYFKMIKSHTKDENIITVDFKVSSNNKLITKATYSKMARGLMLRYLAINKANDLELIKSFQEFGFKFSTEFSNDNYFLFIKEE